MVVDVAAELRRIRGSEARDRLVEALQIEAAAIRGGGEHERPGAEGVIRAELHEAGVDGGAAGIIVRPVQDEVRTAGIGGGVAHQCAGARDQRVHGDRICGSHESQRAGCHGKRARQRHAARQGERVGVPLCHRATAGDAAGERDVVRSVEHERRIRRDVADDLARRAASADLERAAGDRGVAGEAIAAAQDLRAGAGLDQGDIGPAEKRTDLVGIGERLACRRVDRERGEGVRLVVVDVAAVLRRVRSSEARDRLVEALHVEAAAVRAGGEYERPGADRIVRAKLHEAGVDRRAAGVIV